MQLFYNRSQIKMDYIKRIITLTDDFLAIYSTMDFNGDHIKRLITLTSDYIKWLLLYLKLSVKDKGSVLSEHLTMTGFLTQQPLATELEKMKTFAKLCFV